MSCTGIFTVAPAFTARSTALSTSVTKRWSVTGVPLRAWGFEAAPPQNSGKSSAM